MDSINRNQPEDNYEDLQGEEARRKIRELSEKADTCFFCTYGTTDGTFITRPMAIQEVDDDGSIWFLSANDSHKNQEISFNSKVDLLFQGSSYSDFLRITGNAVVLEDRSRIKELWNPALKVWFTEGEDDPRISVIRVDPIDGYYWDTKNPKAVTLLKRIAGAITGKTLDDSIEGRVSV